MQAPPFHLIPVGLYLLPASVKQITPKFSGLKQQSFIYLIILWLSSLGWAPLGGSPVLSWVPPVSAANGRLGRTLSFWTLPGICQVSGSDRATCFLPPKGQPRHVHRPLQGLRD